MKGRVSMPRLGSGYDDEMEAGFDTIITERLVIRRLRDNDLEALVAYRALPEVMALQGWDSFDAEKGHQLIAGCKVVEPFIAGKPFQLGIGLKATDELVGDLYINMTDDGKQAEIGFTFDPRHQGQGLATEAVHALLNFAFIKKGLHRVYGTTDPRNSRSIALMQRVGMRQEAHFRESLWFKGEWADDVVFAVLEREWEHAQ